MQVWGQPCQHCYKASDFDNIPGLQFKRLDYFFFPSLFELRDLILIFCAVCLQNKWKTLSAANFMETSGKKELQGLTASPGLRPWELDTGEYKQLWKWKTLASSSQQYKRNIRCTSQIMYCNQVKLHPPDSCQSPQRHSQISVPPSPCKKTESWPALGQEKSSPEKSPIWWSVPAWWLICTLKSSPALTPLPSLIGSLLPRYSAHCREVGPVRNQVLNEHNS